MDNDVKKIIAVLSVVVIVSLMIYGSYLPLHKAQAYLNALRASETQQFASVDALIDVFRQGLTGVSPIGQEELIRNTANSMLSLVQNEKRPEVIKALVSFTETAYAPVVARKKGMSFGQDLYLLGIINEIAFIKTKDTNYLGAAQKYYLLGSDLGPSRPQPLYGLLDVARLEGNTTAYKAIAERVLDLWPSDVKVKAQLDELNKSLTGKK